MSRYRSTNARYASINEAPNLLGDSSWVGIDEKTPDPTLLQPGYLRKAQNIRIENSSAITRPGMIYASSLNATSFGRIWGRGEFSDPNSIRWELIAVSSGVWLVADEFIPQFVSFPVSLTLSYDVELVQAFNKVYLFQGTNANPMVWDGNVNHTFVALPTPTAGKDPIPQADTAEFYANRLLIPFNKDRVAASDIGDYFNFNWNFNNFQINSGEADNLVRIFPWTKTDVIMFKTQGIHLAQNVTGDLTSLSLTPISKKLGLCGRRAVVQVGTEIYFMDISGVHKISQVFEGSPQAMVLPISEPIIKTLRMINWNAADGIRANYRRDRLYFAVPLGANQTRNNALLVYNLVTNAWESVDRFKNTAFGIDELLDINYNGERRLFALDKMVGKFYLLEEGQLDLFAIDGTGQTEIEVLVRTRGYNGPGLRNSFRRVKLNLATWDPNISVTAIMDGVNRSKVLTTNLTKDRTKYYTFDTPPWDQTNVNLDWEKEGRQDYSIVLPPSGMLLGNGVILDQKQEVWEPFYINMMGAYCELEISNTEGMFELRSVVFEDFEAERTDRTQV